MRNLTTQTSLDLVLILCVLTGIVWGRTWHFSSRLLSYRKTRKRRKRIDAATPTCTRNKPMERFRDAIKNVRQTSIEWVENHLATIKKVDSALVKTLRYTAVTNISWHYSTNCNQFWHHCGKKNASKFEKNQRKDDEVYNQRFLAKNKTTLNEYLKNSRKKLHLKLHQKSYYSTFI